MQKKVSTMTYTNKHCYVLTSCRCLSYVTKM